MDREIKIVFSDVDSTLLMPDEAFPSKRFFSMAEELGRHGVIFCVASGRPYGELHQLFAPVKNQVIFVALNGSVVMRKGELLQKRPIPKEMICRSLNMTPTSTVVLHGAERIYFRQGGKETSWLPKEWMVDKTEISGLQDLSEEIYQISYYREDSGDFARFCNYVANNKKLECVYQDSDWSDFIVSGGNKGVAAEVMMREMGIRRDEAMAFGDSDNDLFLLKAVQESYAMEKATPKIRAVARYTCQKVEDTLAEQFPFLRDIR